MRLIILFNIYQNSTQLSVGAQVQCIRLAIVKHVIHRSTTMHTHDLELQWVIVYPRALDGRDASLCVVLVGERHVCADTAAPRPAAAAANRARAMYHDLAKLSILPKKLGLSQNLLGVHVRRQSDHVHEVPLHHAEVV